MTSRRRYTSPGHGAARWVAQRLVMKPTIWSLVAVKVHGRERLKNVHGPFIVCGNHSSHLDAPLVIGSLPQRLAKNVATGVAADYFFDHWWKAGPVVVFFNAFPVERGKGLRGRDARGKGRRGLAGHLLDDGVPLMIFPEGTRSRTGAIGHWTVGSASLAISRQVPVLPVALVGAAAAMPRGQALPHKGRPPVHVVFGDPMYPAPGETAHEFADRIQARIVQLHDECAERVGLPTQQQMLAIAAEKAAAAKELEASASAETSTPQDPESGQDQTQAASEPATSHAQQEDQE